MTSSQALQSAVYEGRVTHRRHGPRPHKFSYRLGQLYLDLDEIDTVFRSRWLWSVNRRNLAEWRRTDYLGPIDRPLSQAVRESIARDLGRAPEGPVRLLTHPRYGGYVFNPVSFYYCYHVDGTTLEAIVADITNTPWRERYSYVLPVAEASSRGRSLEWSFEKAFPVSPFVPMNRRYAWTFTSPGTDLNVHMRVLESAGCEFDATLALKRRRLDGASLARLLWRYPLMTARVIAAINWEAARLWLKGNPVYDHPRARSARSAVSFSRPPPRPRESA